MAILEVERLCKSFGGVRAIDQLDLAVEKGEILGLIGPNGSGKTTLFNLIAGALRSDEGAIRFLGKDVTGSPSHRRCAGGIARTFQIPRPFTRMLLLRNVMVGRFYGRNPPTGMKEAMADALRILEFVGLQRFTESPASRLNAADRKKLELAKALAAAPLLLLVDELMAGLNPTETESVLSILQKVRERGVTIILVEHIVKAVMKTCDRVVVLNLGRKIAEGAPKEVAQDPNVIQAYLGKAIRVLDLEEIEVHYGDLQALWGVSLSIREGELVTMIGANGSGKSTVLKTVVGWLRPSKGDVRFQGISLKDKTTWKIVEMGICLVPEGRGMFPGMSVLENLQMGAFAGRARKKEKRNLEEVFRVFPRLETRKNQPAETMSGGEQQMLAIGRGLMSEPRLMLIDEVSQGLAPLITENIFEVIGEIHRSGVTVCFVEQNAVLALEVAERAYVVDEGRVVRHGDAKTLLTDKSIQEAYLGAE